MIAMASIVPTDAAANFRSPLELRPDVMALLGAACSQPGSPSGIQALVAELVEMLRVSHVRSNRDFSSRHRAGRGRSRRSKSSGAQGGNRTLMALRPADFESAAYTSSATWA